MIEDRIKGGVGYEWYGGEIYYDEYYDDDDLYWIYKLRTA